MKQAAKRRPQPFTSFALAQTRVRLKRVVKEIARATKHPKNPDATHDLRVAIRRFTQCLRTFEELLDPGSVKRMRKKLRKLMNLCGARRDYDVGIQVLADAGLPPDHPSFASFQEHRDHAMRELARALGHKHKWQVVEHWRKELTRRKQLPRIGHASSDWNWACSVAGNARRTLPRLAEEFFRNGAATIAAARGKYELLHPFRLRGKRFRYTLEVFVPCYSPSLEPKLHALRELQDRMGAIHDCVVVLKLPGMNRSAAAAVRKLIAKRAAEFRRYWHKAFSHRNRESWKRILEHPRGHA
jgi:CHAD domain-containing protein